MPDFPERIAALQPFWGTWRLHSLLGEGSYGKVYRIQREDYGTRYDAALKWISLPLHQTDLARQRAEGFSEPELQAYYRDIVDGLRREIALMMKLRRSPHIVGYEDHLLLERRDEIGWDILIRMELLTPLPSAFAKGMTVGDVVRMACDICGGLENCRQYGIIHRDIKPDNLFVSPQGDCRLGDFGVAKRMDATMATMSRQGTPMYMAPEVYVNQQHYDLTVDLYSLGLVMHRLLNRQRVPFLPVDGPIPTQSDRNRALERRIHGEPIPPPAMGGPALAEVIARACAFRPADRYQTPLQMRDALRAASQHTDMQMPLLTNATVGVGLNSGRSSLQPPVAAQGAGRAHQRAQQPSAAQTTPLMQPQETHDDQQTVGVWQTGTPRQTAPSRQDAPRQAAQVWQGGAARPPYRQPDVPPQKKGGGKAVTILLIALGTVLLLGGLAYAAFRLGWLGQPDSAAPAATVTPAAYETVAQQSPATAAPTNTPTRAPTDTPVPATDTPVPVTATPSPVSTTPAPAIVTLPPADRILPISDAGAFASLITSKSRLLYDASLLLDGQDDTSWQFRISEVSQLSDVYVELYLQSPSCVKALWIKNGFWKVTQGYDQYSRNGRLRQVELTFLYSGASEYTDAITLEIQDDKHRTDWQKLSLGVSVENVAAVRMRVMQIYAGSKFPDDVAVSELCLIGYAQ